MSPTPHSNSSTQNASSTAGASASSSWRPSSGSAATGSFDANSPKTKFEIEIGRIMARRYLLFFMEHVLGIDCLYTREPAVRRWITAYGEILYQWLTHRWDRDEDGTLIQKVPIKILKVLPRKTFKTATNETVVPWLLQHDPNLVCGIMSASYEDLAVPIARSMREHLAGESPDNHIALFFGEQRNPEQWAGDRFTVATRTEARRDPSLQAYGARKGAVGHHFDFFCFDDLVTNEAMKNDSDWLGRVKKTWVDSKATINPNGLVDLTMTRYHDQDPAGYVWQNEIKPAVREHFGGKLPDDWSDTDPAALRKYGHLAGWHIIYEQAVLDLDTPNPRYQFPNIWGPERVAEVRSGQASNDDDSSDEYSELFFWCQLQNQPQKRGDNPITDDHIAIALGSPEPWSIEEAPRTGFVNFHCDFAFKDQEAYIAQRGDVGACHVVSQRDGFVWRVNGYRGKVTQDIFGEKLIDLAVWSRDVFRARVHTITFDLLPGQGTGDKSTEMWIHNLFRRYGLPIPYVKPLSRAGKKKEARILGTAWAWQEGWVRLCKEAPFNAPLVYQMQRIGYTRPDDDADCFADCFHPDIYKVAQRANESELSQWDWKSVVDDDLEDDDSWLLPKIG